MSLFDSASLIVTPNGYKEDKLYSIKPSDGSGDLVVTRATTATRVNSDGLIEVTPYNLFKYSEQFDNAIWSKYQCSVISNSVTAPNGTLTADTVTDTSTFGIIYQSIAFSNASQVVTYSIYLKKSNNDWVNVSISRDLATTYGEFGAWFNLSTGAIGSNYLQGAGVLINKEIESVGNGWFRCSITGYVPNATAYLPFVFNSNADNSSVSSIGQSHYQWGAQVVTGTSAKEYFPTTDRLDVPRLDYTNSTCPSILVEPQRTNLATYSEQFDNSDWLKYQCSITANQAISPDGTQNADLFSATAAGNPVVYKVGQTTRAMSFYAKALNLDGARFYMSVDGVGNAQWNEDGTLFSTNGTTSTKSENLGNGWFRFTGVFASGSVLNFGVTNATTSTTIYIWGAQNENATYATSYIPTQGSSVTRNADVISKTGISSLIGQTEGTLFFEGSKIGLNNSEFYISDGTYDNHIRLQYFDNTNVIFGVVVLNGVAQCVLSTSAFTVSNNLKIALKYKTNDFALWVNGTEVAVDTSGNTFSGNILNRINLAQPDNNPSFYANLKNLIVWKTALTNTELAQLTTI